MDEDKQYQLHIRIARKHAIALPDEKDRIRALKWIQKIHGTVDDGAKRAKRHILQLLIICLQRKRLVGPFAAGPQDKPLLDHGWAYQPVDIAKLILQFEFEKAGRPPISIELAGSLCEYVAYQEIPSFGAHFFYAFSPENLTKWDNLNKEVIPRGMVNTTALTSPDTSILARSVRNSMERKRDEIREKAEAARKKIEQFEDVTILHPSGKLKEGFLAEQPEAKDVDMSLIDTAISGGIIKKGETDLPKEFTTDGGDKIKGPHVERVAVTKGGKSVVKKKKKNVKPKIEPIIDGPQHWIETKEEYEARQKEEMYSKLPPGLRKRLETKYGPKEKPKDSKREKLTASQAYRKSKQLRYTKKGDPNEIQSIADDEIKCPQPRRGKRTGKKEKIVRQKVEPIIDGPQHWIETREEYDARQKQEMYSKLPPQLRKRLETKRVPKERHFDPEKVPELYRRSRKIKYTKKRQPGQREDSCIISPEKSDFDYGENFEVQPEDAGLEMLTKAQILLEAEIEAGDIFTEEQIEDPEIVFKEINIEEDIVGSDDEVCPIAGSMKVSKRILEIPGREPISQAIFEEAGETCYNESLKAVESDDLTPPLNDTMLDSLLDQKLQNLRPGDSTPRIYGPWPETFQEDIEKLEKGEEICDIFSAPEMAEMETCDILDEEMPPDMMDESDYGLDYDFQGGQGSITSPRKRDIFSAPEMAEMEICDILDDEMPPDMMDEEDECMIEADYAKKRDEILSAAAMQTCDIFEEEMPPDLMEDDECMKEENYGLDYDMIEATDKLQQQICEKPEPIKMSPKSPQKDICSEESPSIDEIFEDPALATPTKIAFAQSRAVSKKLDKIRNRFRELRGLPPVAPEQADIKENIIKDLFEQEAPLLDPYECRDVEEEKYTILDEPIQEAQYTKPLVDIPQKFDLMRSFEEKMDESMRKACERSRDMSSSLQILDDNEMEDLCSDDMIAEPPPMHTIPIPPPQNIDNWGDAIIPAQNLSEETFPEFEDDLCVQNAVPERQDMDRLHITPIDIQDVDNQSRRFVKLRTEFEKNKAKRLQKTSPGIGQSPCVIEDSIIEEEPCLFDESFPEYADVSSGSLSRPEQEAANEVAEILEDMNLTEEDLLPGIDKVILSPTRLALARSIKASMDFAMLKNRLETIRKLPEGENLENLMECYEGAGSVAFPEGLPCPLDSSVPEGMLPALAPQSTGHGPMSLHPCPLDAPVPGGMSPVLTPHLTEQTPMTCIEDESFPFEQEFADLEEPENVCQDNREEASYYDFESGEESALRQMLGPITDESFKEIRRKRKSKEFSECPDETPDWGDVTNRFAMLRQATTAPPLTTGRKDFENVESKFQKLRRLPAVAERERENIITDMVTDIAQLEPDLVEQIILASRRKRGNFSLEEGDHSISLIDDYEEFPNYEEACGNLHYSLLIPGRQQPSTSPSPDLTKEQNRQINEICSKFRERYGSAKPPEYLINPQYESTTCPSPELTKEQNRQINEICSKFRALRGLEPQAEESTEDNEMTELVKSVLQDVEEAEPVQEQIEGHVYVEKKFASGKEKRRLTSSAKQPGVSSKLDIIKETQPGKETLMKRAETTRGLEGDQPCPPTSKIQTPPAATSKLRPPSRLRPPTAAGTSGIPTSRIPCPPASRIPCPPTSRIPCPPTSKVQPPSASRAPCPPTSRIQPPSASRIPPPSASRLPPPSASRLPPPSASRLQPPSASRLPPPSASRLQRPSASRLQPPSTARQPCPPTRLQTPVGTCAPPSASPVSCPVARPPCIRPPGIRPQLERISETGEQTKRRVKIMSPPSAVRHMDPNEPICPQIAGPTFEGNYVQDPRIKGRAKIFMPPHAQEEARQRREARERTGVTKTMTSVTVGPSKTLEKKASIQMTKGAGGKTIVKQNVVKSKQGDQVKKKEYKFSTKKGPNVCKK